MITYELIHNVNIYDARYEANKKLKEWALKNIFNYGKFSNVKINTTQSSDPNIMDVTFSFIPTKPIDYVEIDLKF